MKLDENDDGRKSRSQKKRESTAVQKTGMALAALPKNDLETLGLPESLLAALLDWKKFPGHEAKRRQMQFIGRLMRDMDLAAIEDALDGLLSPNRAQTQTFHGIEALRDKLVNADGEAMERELADLARRYPSAPVARLRHLGLTAKSERAGKKPPRAYREIFRLLRGLEEGPGE